MAHRTTRACVLIAALLPPACGDGPTAPSELIGIEWHVVSVQFPGQPPEINERPDLATLRLEADGTAAVREDCNSCGGRYTLSDGRLTVSGLVCTLAFCPPADGVLRPMVPYPGLLAEQNAVRTDGTTLTLTSKAGTLRYAR
jgi:heat shock protein HslJ